MRACFTEPGRDGHLPAGTNLWCKGVVYTHRPPSHTGAEYRVATGFKGGMAAHTGFEPLYRRVRALAEHAMTGHSRPGAPRPAPHLLCHAWGSIPGTTIATALCMLGVGTPHDQQPALSEPTGEELLRPGGSTPEEITGFKPQAAEEFYNEFDFTSASESGIVTMSYGEPIAEPPRDFEPYVRSAENHAAHYHAFLTTQGETRSPFQIVHTEWFLANRDFVTIHICFEKSGLSNTV